MANVNGTMGTTPAPTTARAKQIFDFFRTGSVTPSQSTPTLRASTTGSVSSSGTTVSFTIPSACVVNDLFLLFVEDNSNYPGSNPPGFSQLGAFAPNSAFHVFYKFISATDPGASVSWTGLSNTTYTVAYAAYSNVDTAVPFAAAKNSSTNTLASSFATTTLTTAAAQVCLEAFSVQFNATGGTLGTLASGTNVLISQPTAPDTKGGLIVNQINQSSAGSVGGDTLSVSGSTAYFNSYVIALNGAPTGGTANSAVSFVDVYASYLTGQFQTQYVTWKWPASSNTAHADWYMTVAHQPGSATGANLTFYCCESYNATNHTWNVPVIINVNNNSVTYQPNSLPASTTSPPWAFVATAPNTVGSTYSLQGSFGDTVSNGSSTFFFAANNDGFFYSSTNAGSWYTTFFIGSFTTLVVNPSISDPVNLAMVGWNGNSTAFGGVSREPGYALNNTTDVGYYVPTVFYPSSQTSFSSFAGTINGSMTNNDLWQAPPNQPVAARWQLSRGGNSYAQGNQVGTLRGLLPSWIKYILSTNCNWGDTATDATNSDNLFFAGTNASNTDCWVDTTAA